MRKIEYNGIDISVRDVRFTPEEYEKLRNIILDISMFFGGRKIDVNLKGELEPE